jgi:hypothetical protein
VTDIVSRWREFEARLRVQGLERALNYVPADLRWARDSEHPRGARLDHLLPEDYRTFVAKVGYPMIGIKTNDNSGLSFLPPDPMGRLSIQISDDERGPPCAVEGEPTTCRYAFFAGCDLSDIVGYALAADGVWVVEDSGAIEPIAGSFTEWLLGEIDHDEQSIAKLDADAVAQLREKINRDTDPHRLIDYSLGHEYDVPYSPSDTQLSWVEGSDWVPGKGTLESRLYGLIDADGRWRIPMGKQFTYVRPFRNGVAEVVRKGDRYGEWSQINAEGRAVDDGTS